MIRVLLATESGEMLVGKIHVSDERPGSAFDGNWKAHGYRLGWCELVAVLSRVRGAPPSCMRVIETCGVSVRNTESLRDKNTEHDITQFWANGYSARFLSPGPASSNVQRSVVQTSSFLCKIRDFVSDSYFVSLFFFFPWKNKYHSVDCVRG